MIQEMTQANYLGVLCLHPKEQMPVLRKPVVLYEEPKRSELSHTQGPESRAFALRCNACGEESVYGTEEICEVAGPLRIRRFERERIAAQASREGPSSASFALPCCLAPRFSPRRDAPQNHL
jgi:hypothetical protein